MPVDPIKLIHAFSLVRDKLSPERVSELIDIAKRSLKEEEPEFAVNVALARIAQIRLKLKENNTPHETENDSDKFFLVAIRWLSSPIIYKEIRDKLAKEMSSGQSYNHTPG